MPDMIACLFICLLGGLVWVAIFWLGKQLIEIDQDRPLFGKKVMSKFYWRTYTAAVCTAFVHFLPIFFISGNH